MNFVPRSTVGKAVMAAALALTLWKASPPILDKMSEAAATSSRVGYASVRLTETDKLCLAAVGCYWIGLIGYTSVKVAKSKQSQSKSA